MSTAIENSLVTELADHTGDHSISITMPTFESGRKVNQNAIRFKNLLKSAKEQLESSDADEAVIRERIRALEELQRDDNFWQHQSRGLAVYLDSDQLRTVKLPEPLPEQAHVADTLFVLPIAMFGSSSQSQILKLTWEKAELLATRGKRLQTLESDRLPVSMDDVVLPADKESQLQFRTQQGGDGGAMFHGQDKKEDITESDRHRFLSEVSKRLEAELRGTTGDVYVVATEEVYGHFRSMWDGETVHIAGSPDGLSDDQILKRYSELCASQDGECDGLDEKLSAAVAQGAGTFDVEQILNEALKGRVETLVLDTSCLESEHACEANEAVRRTLQAGGEIRVCELNDGHACGAIYRF